MFALQENSVGLLDPEQESSGGCAVSIPICGGGDGGSQSDSDSGGSSDSDSGDSDDGCDHGDYGSESGPDSPDTDSGSTD